MINEQQEEQAALYVLGALPEADQGEFQAALRGNAELRELVGELQGTTALLALASPQVALPRDLRAKVLQRVGEKPIDSTTPRLAGLRFLNADAQNHWKPLPVPGAWIQLLSLDPGGAYAVLLGKLDPGARYPAHINTGSEDLYVLSGDLHVGERRLGPGDFHHADDGSRHEVNHSVAGCTLLAVLPAEHPLVAVAMG